MKALVKCNKLIEEEWKDLLQSLEIDAIITNTALQLINHLNSNDFHFVFIDKAAYEDFKLVKYINDNFKHVKVFVTADKFLKDNILTMKGSEFTMLNDNITLEEIKRIIEKKDN